MIGKKYAPYGWFRELFGFEETPKAVYKNIKLFESNGTKILKSLANGKEYRPGTFELRTLSSFPTPNKSNGKLNIIHGGGMSGNTSLVNALEAQSRPDMNGATFQVASNFNCLEFTSESQTAADGITDYVLDHTQGPNVSMATGASLLYRNYFVKHSNGKVGQIDQEIRLLENTCLDKFVQHGYPIISRDAASQLPDEDFSELKIGVHRNCQVTTTRCGRDLCHVEGGQFVHQVFTAALNFSGTVHPCDRTLRIAEKLLEREYRATILCAYENSLLFPERKGARKLSLTLLGGGVFNNPSSMICKAICACEDLIVKSGLDVDVVCFSDADFKQNFPYLEKTMVATGGCVIDASDRF